MRAIDPTKVKRVTSYAHSLLGIHEVPDGSNSGPAVHELQTSTGAFGAPWCVSTAQYVWEKVFGHTLYDRSANAYYCGEYAIRHGWAVAHPQPGGHVVYHIGQGHFGTVVKAYPDGTFDAVEGNEGNAVRLMHRDPRLLYCVFIAPPDLFHDVVEKHVKSGITYYTFRRDVPLHHGMTLHFKTGEGYYADKED